MLRVLYAVLAASLLALSCFLYPEGEAGEPGTLLKGVEIDFSLESGFYNGDQSVTLSINTEEATIYYSTDGSVVSLESFTMNPSGFPYIPPKPPATFTPSPPPPVVLTNSAAQPYTAALDITQNTLLRARAYHGEVPVSKEYSRMYFIDETITLPVFSLVVDPRHFWDDRIGIYVPGPLDGINPMIGSYGEENFYQDWERPVHIAFFEDNQSFIFAIDGGVKIFGGWSRGWAQKSLALFARPEYGAAVMDYDFFGLTDNQSQLITSYSSLVLRNSGDDWWRTMFRDALQQSITNGMNIDRQAYRPGILFLNGQYWGIHNLREKVNEKYLAAHYDYVNSEQVDILTHYDSRVVEGDDLNFNNLLDFVQDNDLTDPANYAIVETWIDISNLIDYSCAQLFFNNGDWPFSNIKYWRPRTSTGKWRWILYDTDAGFGGKDWNEEVNAFDRNSLAVLLDDAQSGSDFRKLFFYLTDNRDFSTAFVDRFRELLTTNFAVATIDTQIVAMASVLGDLGTGAGEIARHNTTWPDSAGDWTNAVTTMRDFVSDRHPYWSGWLDDFELAVLAYIKNGEFTDGSFWNEGWVDSGDFDFNNFSGDVGGGTINGLGPAPFWGDIVMFYQDHISLSAGITYELTFKAWCDSTNQIGVVLANDEPWIVYSNGNDGEYFVVDLTTDDTATFSTTFTMPDDNFNVWIYFVAGESDNGTVYVDDVVLNEL